MGKLVLFNLVEDDYQSGFSVSLQIFEEEDRRLIADTEGRLPPATELVEHYDGWQKSYRKRVGGRSSARISAKGYTDAEILTEIRNAKDQLHLSVNNWLNPHNQGDFSPIWTKILKTMRDEDEEIRVIVKTENKELQQLPWYIWDEFFEHYRRAEVCLYLPVTTKKRVTSKDKVKILAVFGNRESVGNTTRIRTEKDWEALKKYLSKKSNVEIIRLSEPTLEELYYQIEEQCPQILFFAGHSSSKEDGTRGQIELNQEQSITIDDLKCALRDAVDRGLQLAIFNSCDGFGIAQQLGKLGIPNIIVMREPVPDEVAQKFLEHFLEAFAAGNALQIAVRKAREKISHLERELPGAGWLPTIFQNPAEAPLTWQGLGGLEVQRQSNLADRAGEGSEAEKQSSILWLRTLLGNLSQGKQQLTAPIVSNTSKSKQQQRSPIVTNNQIRPVVSPWVIIKVASLVGLVTLLMFRKAVPTLRITISTEPEKPLASQPKEPLVDSSILANVAPNKDVMSAEDERSLTTQPREQQATPPSKLNPSDSQSDAPPDPPSYEASYRRNIVTFFCGEDHGIPATKVRHPSRGEVVLIRWVTNYWHRSPLNNCQEVSARFQDAQEKEILGRIVIRTLDDYPVICASRSKYGPCEGLLFKVPREYDPDEIVQEMLEINSGVKASPIHL